MTIVYFESHKNHGRLPRITTFRITAGHVMGTLSSPEPNFFKPQPWARKASTTVQLTEGRHRHSQRSIISDLYPSHDSSHATATVAMNGVASVDPLDSGAIFFFSLPFFYNPSCRFYF